MCKLYKHNKHNANLTMSPPLEPHAPQLENQAPCQAAVVLVLVAIVVAVVTTAEVVVVAVVVTVVPTVVVVVAVVAKTRHHVQGRHFNFLQSFLSTPGFEISFLTQIWQFSQHAASTQNSDKNENLPFQI